MTTTEQLDKIIHHAITDNDPVAQAWLVEHICVHGLDFTEHRPCGCVE